MMDLPNGWSQEQLAWLKPDFANILSQNPLLPPLDFVSDRNLLDALRQQLSLVDAKVVIPDDLKKEEVKMPNGMMANLFRRRNDTSQLKEGAAQGAVLIVHGGGYVAGTTGIMTQTAIALTQDTNLVSIVLPYRLAPEAPFPAGIKDIYDGFLYVVENAKRLSIDTEKLALYGQSAGSDIAILAYLAYLQSNIHLPRFKALILSSPIYPSAQGEDFPTSHCHRNVDWCWNSMSHKSALAAYRGEKVACSTTQFSHLHTSQVSLEDLALLPPTHVHVGQVDFLAQEAVQLSSRMMLAGVPLSLELREGDVHIGLDVFIATEAGKASRVKVMEHLKMNLKTHEKVVLEKRSSPTGPIPQFPIDVDSVTVTDIVKQYNSQTPHKRLQQILDLAVSHLHDFVREANLSMDEWMQGISFLTRVGKMCSDIRQEFILLSDVLGVSVLVDSLNNIKPKGATPSTILGPFHTEDAPILNKGDNMVSLEKLAEGTPMLVRGFVRDLQGNGIPNAELETWETDASGHYDTQYSDRSDADCRGIFHTEQNGAYEFRCIVPVSYPIPSDGPVGDLLGHLQRHVFRPAHLHMKIQANGFPTLVTALYPRDDKFLQSDAVLGVKSALVCDLKTITEAGKAKEAGFTDSNDFVLLEWDFILSP